MTQTTTRPPTPALRPEARAVDPGKLDLRQKAAFDKIMRLLAEASGVVGRPELQVKPERPYLDAERSSRTALIYGRRGTGKTTLLLSLLKTLADPSNDYPVGRNVVLLDTLDMEPLAESTNLIGAVLARLEAVAESVPEAPERAGPWPRAGRVPGEETVMMKLADLQTRAASAFGSNLRDRAGELDPDNFAEEVRRAERHRMDFGHKFALVVADVAKHLKATRADRGQEPLFVLPVDDLDLNPTACVPLLEGLRAVHSPHLFVLLLADLRLVETVLRLQYQARFIRTGRRKTLDSETQGHIIDLTANAVRKHLPPSQRMHLARVSPKQAARFQFIGEDRAADIYAIFRAVRLSTDTIWLPRDRDVTAEAPPRIVGDAKPLWLPDRAGGEQPRTGAEEAWRYSWVEVFRMSFRELLDVVLEAEVDATRNAEGNLDLDPDGNIQLPEEAQHQLMSQIVEQRLRTVVHVTELGVEAHSAVSIRLTATTRPRWTTELLLPESEDYRVQTATLDGWSALWAGTSLERAEQRELAGILDIEGAEADLPSVAHIDRICPALRRTLPPGDDQWTLDWPMPQHSTCWGYEDAARLLADADKSWEKEPDRHFGAWVDAMTQVIEQALGIGGRASGRTGWPSLCKRLRKLGRHLLGRRWRVEVLALCAREMGMSDPGALRAMEMSTEEEKKVQELRDQRSQNRRRQFQELAAGPLWP